MASFFFKQYCAFSENIRFLNSDVCKAVRFYWRGATYAQRSQMKLRKLIGYS